MPIGAQNDLYQCTAEGCKKWAWGQGAKTRHERKTGHTMKAAENPGGHSGMPVRVP